MSGFWRLRIGISDRDIFPYGERGGRTGTKNIKAYCWLAEFRQFTLVGRMA